MSPRPNVSEERKPQILSAAEIVFARKGFSDTRMDDIAGETGLSKGTLYLYYKSKDELIIAILNRIFQHQFQEMENLLTAGIDTRERILQCAELVIKDASTMLHLTPIAYEFLTLAFRNKHVRQSLKIYFNRYMNILEPLIQQGITSGEFRQVDAREAAIAACTIFEGTILLWVYDKSQVDVARHIRTSINFFT